MKKIFAMVLTLVLTVSVCRAVALADANDSVEVYVTVADGNGALALAQERITVTDTDGDGVLSMHDALYAAHEAHYEGGAAAGYASSDQGYGLSLDKLWGTANGGSYGYYLNHASPLSLADPVQEGDYINAYAYRDLTAWSDMYCYFDTDTVTVEEGEEITLTLTGAGFDGAWNPIAVPVAGATLTVNGEATETVTDAEGKATLTLEAGEYVISAVSDTQVLAPPVCRVNVNGDEPTPAPETPEFNAPPTGDDGVYGIYVLLAMVSMAGVCVLVFGNGKMYEK